MPPNYWSGIDGNGHKVRNLSIRSGDFDIWIICCEFGFTFIILCNTKAYIHSF